MLIALFGIVTGVPFLRQWPLFWIVPLAGYTVIVMATPQLRASFRLWGFGRISKATVISTGVIAIGSIVALVSFHILMRPDVSGYRALVPMSRFGGVVVFGVIFCLLNALFEEVVFRGILFDAIESQWNVWVTIIATAFLFSVGHMRGYPPGPIGALLAGVYALCLGWLRWFSGGIGLPIVAHIVADATIVTLVATSTD